MVGNHHPDGGVGTHIIDVPWQVHCIIFIAGLGQQEKRVVVVAFEYRIIDCPNEMTSGVDRNIDAHLDCRTRVLD